MSNHKVIFLVNSGFAVKYLKAKLSPSISPSYQFMNVLNAEPSSPSDPRSFDFGSFCRSHSNQAQRVCSITRIADAALVVMF